MAVMNYYNALGRGASVKSGDFIVPGSNVSVDPNPLVRWYDFDTIQATYSYNNGEFYLSAFIDYLYGDIYQISSMYLSDSNLNSLVDAFSINISFNIYDDFTEAVSFSNMYSSDDVFSGNDYGDYIEAGAGNDIVSGWSGNDVLLGQSGNDIIDGGAGNDTIYNESGNDQIDGGVGIDWIYFQGSANSVLDLTNSNWQNTGYGTDIIKNIENASGGTGVDKFYGTGGNNTLKGNNGNDLLYGQNGNDKLYGGNGNDKSYGQAGNDSLYMDAGNDTLDGGTGTDWLYVTGSTNSVVNLAKTTGQNTGYGTDIIKNIENASGGSGVDRFYGTSGNNTLKGNNGNDILQGKNGNDNLQGGNNNDKLYGGSGNDKLYGGAGNDILDDGTGTDYVDGGAGIDTFQRNLSKDYRDYAFRTVVDLSEGKFYAVGYENDFDTLISIENVNMTGNFHDRIIGTSGNNILKGNNGNDLIYGQNGNDTLYGGNNNDKLYGGSGNDTLRGDAGRDVLQGDAGKDTLYGGADADTFVFRKTSDSSASASSADIIRDFTRGVDKIDLHFIDASTKLSGNNAFTFDGITSFGTSKEGDIYYKQFNNVGTSNDYTMVYIDTDNDTAAEMSIKLMGLYNLTASDFIL